MSRHLAPLAAPLLLAACVSQGVEPPPLPSLANDPGQPILGLLEYLATDHFATFGANPPTTCVSLRPGPLTAEQEEALIARFVRLAPGSRCRAQAGAHVDAITGAPAVVIEVYEVACREPTRCTAWAAAPGKPATRYAMRYEAGSWRFTADPRRIAE